MCQQRDISGYYPPLPKPVYLMDDIKIKLYAKQEENLNMQ